VLWSAGAAAERSGDRRCAGGAVALGTELCGCSGPQEQDGASGEGQRDAGGEGGATGEASAGW